MFIYHYSFPDNRHLHHSEPTRTHSWIWIIVEEDNFNWCQRFCDKNMLYEYTYLNIYSQLFSKRIETTAVEASVLKVNKE